MCKLNKCCCFELETGGKIIGWLNIILSVILSVILILAITGLSAVSCETLVRNSGKHDFGSQVSYFLDIPNAKRFDDFETCQGLLIAGKILATFCLVIVIIKFSIYSLFLVGIDNRNLCQIMPVVIIQGISTVSYIIYNIFTFTRAGMFNTIFIGSIEVFIFIIIYSLYVKIRDEKGRSFYSPS